LLGRYAYRSIVRIPKSLLVPSVALLTVIGSFAIQSNPGDTQMMVTLGILAWVFQRFGFAPSPIVLGLVLGQIAEQGFVQAYMIGHATGNLAGMFFGRPIGVAIIAAALLTLTYPLIAPRLRGRGRAKSTPEHIPERTDLVVEASQSAVPKARDVPTILFGLTFIVVGALALVGTQDMSAMGRIFPRVLSVTMIALSALMIVVQLRLPRKVPRPSYVDKPAVRPSTFRRVAITVVLAAWALSMPAVGFFTSSMIAFMLITAIASFERPGTREIAMDVVVALIVVGAFQFLMHQVLGLHMPQDLLL
jgi:putative tricarboxylic transport membrane protein